MKDKENKLKRIYIRVSIKEYKQIEGQFKKTTARKLSEYCRNMLLGKPLVATVRDQSLDDFMAELIDLKNKLNAIGNNYNQSVRKLHTLQHNSQVEQWMITTELERRNLQKNVTAIELTIGKFADVWLR